MTYIAFVCRTIKIFYFKLTSDAKIQPAITGREDSCFWLSSPWSRVDHALCRGAKVQVTGHRSRVRSQGTGQVTGQITGHTKTTGHWTKLFLIDILLYKNKTSQGTSIIFFLFWTLPNSTHEKIYSCWSRKEDLHYSVTKVGNEITKVRKITWFVRKNESQNEGLLC